MDKMREDFEKWVKDHEFCTYKIGDDYKYMSTQHSWVVWQASRAALCVEIPEPEMGNGCFISTTEVEIALDNAGVSYK